MTLPVDVVIPHLPSRDWFFQRFSLPSIEAQNPSRIIVESGPGGACEKRNKGARESTAKYVFFMDDDIILGQGHMAASITVLEAAHSQVSYTYSDWIQVPLPGCMDPPLTTAQYVKIPAFEHLPLHEHGGIDLPIVRRSDFLPFDTALPRYQTWDWALTMKKAGRIGQKIEGYNYVSFMLDRGISTGLSLEESIQARTYIQRKHGFIP